MKITFVGAGNVAWHLAAALAVAGHEIVCVYSRTLQAANSLVERVGQGSVATNEIDKILPADAYVIVVKDDALPIVVASLPKHCHNGVVLHTAGTQPMELLTQASSHIGVLYPLQTFTKGVSLDFKEITCFIESSDASSEEVIKELAESITDKVVCMTSEERRHLHLAAVFACNFSNHMYALAYEILQRNNVEPDCLIPLIEETSRKLRKMAPHEGQTGPARRADETVLKRQYEELSFSSELQDLYQTISKSIMLRFKTK